MSAIFCSSQTKRGIHKTFLIAFLLTLTIPSCTIQTVQKSSPQKISKKLPDLREIENWTWKGKFVFKKKNEARVGSLTWKKKGLSNYIAVKGPLGIKIGSFLIRDGQILNQKAGELRNSQHLSRSLDELFLYDLPFDSIHIWLLGLAPSKYSNSSIQHQNKNLQITYLDLKIFNGYFLPSQIFLQSEFVQIKLVTLDWHQEND